MNECYKVPSETDIRCAYILLEAPTATRGSLGCQATWRHFLLKSMLSGLSDFLNPRLFARLVAGAGPARLAFELADLAASTAIDVLP